MRENLIIYFNIYIHLVNIFFVMIYWSLQYKKEKMKSVKLFCFLCKCKNLKGLVWAQVGEKKFEGGTKQNIQLIYQQNQSPQIVYFNKS